MYQEIIAATVLLVALIDPFISLAALLSVKEDKEFSIPKTATTACLIAGALMLLFIFLGSGILDLFHISIEAFKIGGGLIILILGIHATLGKEWTQPGHKAEIAVVIGTPLITGPGVATTLILLRQEGLVIPLIAGGLALLITWIFLVFAQPLQRLVGDQLVRVFSRVLGLLLAAYAVQLILDGLGVFLNIVPA